MLCVSYYQGQQDPPLCNIYLFLMHVPEDAPALFVNILSQGEIYNREVFKL
jgi:hypothetical protein